MGHPPWTPVLDEHGPRALDRARQIANRLRPDPGDPTLGGGQAGLALLWAALGDERRAGDALDLALRALAATPLPGGLIDGYAGVGFVAAQLGRDVAPVDAALIRWLGRPERPWDLVSGLVGVGLYALERGPAGLPVLQGAVDQLGALVVPMDVGHSWPGVVRSEPVALGRSNLGVAHGTPGVIALLGRAVRVGVRGPVEGAVRHVLAARGPVRGRRLPYSVGDDADPRPARTAWCYGDPGVAAALWVAGHDQPEWRAAALELALDAAAVGAEEGGVAEDTLCHGAAGLGLIFQRLGVASGEGALLDAARHWYTRALDRDEDRGPRLLTGDLGLALALVAAATDREPVWDRALALSDHQATR